MSVRELLLAEWGVTCGEPARSGFNEVWFARRGDEHVVVKTGESMARRREAAALASYREGAARLLIYDEPTATLVVERLLLGDDLVPMSRSDDDGATIIVGTVINSLHRTQSRPDLVDLPSLRSLQTVFDNVNDERIPTAIVDRAAGLFDELTASEDDSVVVHGDLHHTNVLRDGEGTPDDRWRAIDPHGWLGDPVFDTAALLANPRGLSPTALDGVDARGILSRAERRITILAEVTGYDPDRIRSWAFVAAVIAELWMIADHGMVHGAPLALAQELVTRV